MQVAISADLHLTSKKTNPERFETFDLLLRQTVQNHIQHLILAGDVFDSISASYADFDRICSQSEYQSVKIAVLLGNHDRNLKKQYFTASNIAIIEKPELMQFDLLGMPVLCLPYLPVMTMGQILASLDIELPPNQWILIGHGDWADGLKTFNETEPGIYMPLTRSDVETYQPIKVVLGHIHKPFDGERVHYPGSPCPLNINETGPRRFLVLDTENGGVTAHTLDSARIFFNEVITLLPGPDEWKWLEQRFDHLINGWRQQISNQEHIRIRLRFQGFTSDKSRLAQLVGKSFGGFQFYQDEGPDFQDVFVAEDPKLEKLSEAVIQAIGELPFKADFDDPDKQSIIFHALKTIYGV